MGRPTKNNPWREDEPPSIKLIRARYIQAGHYAWNNARLARLCAYMQATLREVCAYAGEFSHDNVKRHQKADTWPLPMAIHFTNLEAPFLEAQREKAPQ